MHAWFVIRAIKLAQITTATEYDYCHATPRPGDKCVFWCERTWRHTETQSATTFVALMGLGGTQPRQSKVQTKATLQWAPDTEATRFCSGVGSAQHEDGPSPPAPGETCQAVSLGPFRLHTSSPAVFGRPSRKHLPASGSPPDVDQNRWWWGVGERGYAYAMRTERQPRLRKGIFHKDAWLKEQPEKNMAALWEERTVNVTMGHFVWVQ